MHRSTALRFHTLSFEEFMLQPGRDDHNVPTPCMPAMSMDTMTQRCTNKLSTFCCCCFFYHLHLVFGATVDAAMVSAVHLFTTEFTCFFFATQSCWLEPELVLPYAAGLKRLPQQYAAKCIMIKTHPQRIHASQSSVLRCTRWLHICIHERICIFHFHHSGGCMHMACPY